MIEHVVIPAEYRERLAAYFDTKLALFMMAYEILTEGKMYSWHLEMDVDHMDKAVELWPILNGEVITTLDQWLEKNKVA
jgi:hypothetical protein